MARRAAQQPQYDLLTGEPISVPVREASRVKVEPASAAQLEDDARAQLYKLKYELETLKQERELEAIRHDEELRYVKSLSESDHRHAQEYERALSSAQSRIEALDGTLEEELERNIQLQAEADKKLRSAQEQSKAATEELEDVRAEAVAQERQLHYEINELKAKADASNRLAEVLKQEKDAQLQSQKRFQEQLAEREVQITELEGQISTLKSQPEDSDAVVIIQSQLSDQVAHIEKLETENTDQKIELQRLRAEHKALAVAQEEKRHLEVKLRAADSLRRELDQARLQAQILQDERRAWTSYLDGAIEEGDEVHISTPEDLARAYMAERIERASLVDKLGQITPELATKEDRIRQLETQLQESKQEQAATQDGASAHETEDKISQRLEGQNKLLQKEVDYLRAQIKAYDDETNEFTPEKYDASKSDRIQQLEAALDGARKEMASLNTQLSAIKKTQAESASKAALGTKRSREPNDEDDQRLSDLRRKNKAMQADVEKLTTSRKILKKELEAARSQITALKSSSQRVLELRDNPTSRAALIKQNTLDTLRAENVALLTKLDKRDGSKGTVPQATVDRLRAEIEQRDAALAEKEKFLKRHRTIFAEKSREFRQAVASLLGWDLHIMPNGRVRVASIFYTDKKEDEDDDEPPGSIVFDGEKQTMKVSGGPKSAFAKEIQDQIKFWVDGRNEIPCFLAACSLEFYDRSTRAMKM